MTVSLFNKALAAVTLLFCALVLLPLHSQTQAADNGSNTGEKKVIKATVSQNEIIDLLETAGIKCSIQEGTGKSSLIVQSVRMGSNAYYKGVVAGDQIKDLNQKTGILTIERDKKIYQLAIGTFADPAQGNALRTGIDKTLTPASASKDQIGLAPGAARLDVRKSPIVPVIDVNDRNGPLLNVKPKELPQNQDKIDEKKLVTYEIELIIDISGSMGQADGTGDLTKFQWCHEQVRQLVQRLAPYQKSLTITTFNRQFETMEGCTPAKVEQIYSEIRPAGGTDLVDPLMTRLNAAIARRNGHPVMIAVITDGLPNIPGDPSVVNRALIDFTRQLHDPNSVVVTFLQIGDTFDGRDFCVDLDDNLVNEGAKYDIVDTKTFAELKREGLLNALVDAILENRINSRTAARTGQSRHSTAALPPPNPEVGRTEQSLKSAEQERREIERQLLGQ